MITIRRLTIGLAAAALAVLLLTGCGTSVADTATAAVPQAAPTAPAPEAPATVEQVYLDTLADGGITLGSDANAIEIGHRVCGVIESGGTPMQVGQVIVSTGQFDHHDAGYIVGAAVGSFCPEYVGMIPGASADL